MQINAYKWARYENLLLHHEDGFEWFWNDLFKYCPKSYDDNIKEWRYIVQDQIQNWLDNNQELVPIDDHEIFWIAISAYAEATNNHIAAILLGGHNIGIHWVEALIKENLIKNPRDIFDLRRDFKYFLDNYELLNDK